MTPVTIPATFGETCRSSLTDNSCLGPMTIDVRFGDIMPADRGRRDLGGFFRDKDWIAAGFGAGGAVLKLGRTIAASGGQGTRSMANVANGVGGTVTAFAGYGVQIVRNQGLVFAVE